MSQPAIKLPYFDFLLQEFAQGNADVETALGRHVHWGYWQDPQTANGTIEDFAEAAENLAKLVYAPTQIQPGMRILDVGCGFGGTIASLNETFSSLELVGLNLDDRQLERARNQVVPINNNKIEFIQGDACQLPFENDSFDVVLAVECIFHFPSRSSFFKEAARVLNSQGKLALSDFVLPQRRVLIPSFFNSLLSKFIASVYGKTNCCTMADYGDLASISGLTKISEQDVTAETMPTYEVVLNLPSSRHRYHLIASLPTQLLKFAQGSRYILYQILAYQKE